MNNYAWGCLFIQLVFDNRIIVFDKSFLQPIIDFDSLKSKTKKIVYLQLFLQKSGSLKIAKNCKTMRVLKILFLMQKVLDKLFMRVNYSAQQKRSTKLRLANRSHYFHTNQSLSLDFWFCPKFIYFYKKIFSQNLFDMDKEAVETFRAFLRYTSSFVLTVKFTFKQWNSKQVLDTLAGSTLF